MRADVALSNTYLLQRRSMNFLPSFVAWPFAVAGLIAAAGPVVIHLLNRRRYQTVPWAAMDFLREALQRNRRILRIRDLLLLLIRTLAVLLVGLALARPFFSTGDQAFDGTEPLHAVLLIDNSLSMGLQAMDGTSLDRAKQRARRFIGRLPAESRVTVLAICGSRFGRSSDATTKAVALQFLERIEIADRVASVRSGINQAIAACRSQPSLAPRVVLFSDQQVLNWYGQFDESDLRGLPQLQVVDVSGEELGNTWISGFRLQDGLADVQTPTTFVVQLRYEGAGGRRDVEVRLHVDGTQVAAKPVRLEPGQGAREVIFQHVFDTLPLEPGGSLTVPVTVTVTADNLPEDDSRCLAVPVVAGLPVVFVDQFGAERENPIQNRIGETRSLRRLLAPSSAHAEHSQHLIHVRHVRLDQLTRDILADVRLVVIAGIADPGDRVLLLREYVQQGGQLVIAAGGQHDPINRAGFDAAAWNAAAWLDGRGILPAPLFPEPLGVTLSEAGTTKLEPFSLSYDSLASHGYFQMSGVGQQELRDLYAEPLFFKAVRVNLEPQVARQLERTERARLAAVPESGRPETLADGGRTADLRSEPADGPRWLLWTSPNRHEEEHELPEDPGRRRRRLEELAARTLPRVLARFDDERATPFLVSRQIGDGDVLFVASGLQTEWNTLPTTNAMVLFDRILRQMVLSTLPTRNFEPAERLAVPLPGDNRDLRVVLGRPGSDRPEVLDAGFIGQSQYGCTIDQPLKRGIYRIAVYREPTDSPAAESQPAWQTFVAVNGPAEESELRSISRDEWEERMGDERIGWVGPGEEISLAGTQVHGQHSWRWLTAAVLSLLSLELLILLGISRSRQQTNVKLQRV